MIWSDFHLYVRQEIDKLDSSTYKDIKPEQIDFLAKRAAYEYVEDRYKQFEKDQQSIDDLRNSKVLWSSVRSSSE